MSSTTLPGTGSNPGAGRAEACAASRSGDDLGTVARDRSGDRLQRAHVRGGGQLGVNHRSQERKHAAEQPERESLPRSRDVAENERRGDDEKKLYVMYDQMYWHLTYGDISHYDPVNLRPAMKEYTIYIDAISKVFAATGVRVGWALGPKKVIAKMRMILTHVGAWAPMAEQKAVARFLKNPKAIDQYLANFKKEIEFRLQEIYKGFQQLNEEGYAVKAIAPEAAIYLTIQLNLAGKKTADGEILDNQEKVTSYILDEAKLAVVPFYAFGAPKTSNWYRLSVGTCKKEEIDQMIGQLRSALKKLQ